MSNPTSTPAEPVAEAAAQPTDQPADSTPPPAEDGTDWKAESRKWEARAKENSKAAARLAEIEEASKSDLQRATERAEQLTKELDGERRFRMQHEAAQKAGLPADLASRLQGDTPEELAADAAKLKSLIPAPTPGNAFRDAQGKQADPKSGDWLRDSLAAR